MKFISRVEQDILFTLEIDFIFPRNHVIFPIYPLFIEVLVNLVLLLTISTCRSSII